MGVGMTNPGALFATDLGEMFDRLTAACQARDVDGAIDAVLDMHSIALGFPGIARPMRQILDGAR